MALIEQYGLVLLNIMFINIILSGDNALVIAMASKDLPENHRKQAMWWGAGAAVVLRIILSLIAVFLLTVPYVQVIGSVLLLWIAIKLLLPQDNNHVKAGTNRLQAIWTIVIADFVMSLDNVLAVAGAADGHKGLVAIGIALTIPLILFASNAILKLMNKWTWIVYLGSGILGHTAGEMFAKDSKINELLPGLHEHATIFAIIWGILTIAIGYGLKKRKEYLDVVDNIHREHFL